MHGRTDTHTHTHTHAHAHAHTHTHTHVPFYRLQTAATDAAKKHFKESWERGRVEFIPVDWRSMLALDKGLIEEITPRGVKQIRNMINASVLDLIYYLSPTFNSEVSALVSYSVAGIYLCRLSQHKSAKCICHYYCNKTFYPDLQKSGVEFNSNMV